MKTKLLLSLLVLQKSMKAKLLLLLPALALSWFHFSPVKFGCVSGNCQNGIGTMVYIDGSKYIGDWKDGKREGKGTMCYAGGDKYVGEWKDDNRNGEGIITYKNETMYANGTKYVGQWKNDRQNGKGTMIYLGGEKYKGVWKDGRQEFNVSVVDQKGGICKKN